ncbi:MAG: hypothetical protein ABI335_21500 [Polyangiaceae bacterium]
MVPAPLQALFPSTKAALMSDSRAVITVLSVILWRFVTCRTRRVI